MPWFNRVAEYPPRSIPVSRWLAVTLRSGGKAEARDFRFGPPPAARYDGRA